ncbi:hypothetical protein [Flavobacterium humi]|uniref:Uncharacterized protein n=1 Tax=Flavobacterium humi TaxID=2562683 RepID=A0A4Z0LD55_9FLAO|nr:hypothetical protein [Flavobacterium humi]TGD59820.1 hypothetical protein E4635_02500 [Flavobacterium humi]
MGTLFFAAMGWCGTKYPGWWWGPKPPHPDPEPWWKYAVISIVGIGVGIAGGMFFNNSIANDTVFAGQGMIASGLFSLAASNIVTGIASIAMDSRKQ